MWLKHTHSEGGDVTVLLLALDVGYTKCPFLCGSAQHFLSH